MRNDELQHHGVPGQKWGIRRYQNKDGSLTPAGRKRAAKLENKYYKVTGKRLNGQQSNRPKTAGEMTNEELRERTTRLRLENDYVREINNYQALHPKKVSLGRKFMSHIGKNVIAPAATEAGKNYLKNYLDNLSKEQKGESLADKVTKLKLENELNKLTKEQKNNNLADKVSKLKLKNDKLKYEANIKRYESGDTSKTIKRYIRKK